MFKFEILTKDGRARRAQLSTPHGVVETPNFVPVGTQATVKTLTPEDLKQIGVQMILANTYHLHLRPGENITQQLGGLHKFSGWNGPMMTDSGGFQVFSLGVAQEEGKKLSKFSKEKKDSGRASLAGMTEQLDEHFHRQLSKGGGLKSAKVDEDGVTFYSHLDGSKHRLDPKISIEIQEKLGADLIVCFDDHESPLWNHEKTKESMERSHRWSLESLKMHKRKDQLMYGVTHGGVYEDLRVESAKLIDEHFAAVAIGGAYTSKEVLYKVIDWSVPHFDDGKPRHLLGIAEIVDLFNGVDRGMDLFDCVAATRRARHGNAYVSPRNGGTVKNNFVIQITNEKYKLDKEPLDPGCECYACANFSRGYVNHLFKASELLGMHLTTYHNVYFVTKLMEKMREAIEVNRFQELKGKWV